MILGLDISTSCTGWCLVDANGNLVKMGYISLQKENSPFAKASKVKRTLSELNINHNIERICIEENLQAFRPGLSSAKTLLTLARFNGVVSYLAQDEFCIIPEFINVNTARKSLGIKIVKGKKAEKSTKDQVLEWVDSQLKTYDWPVKILKSGPRKGQTVLESSCYDMADAYVISRAGIVLEQ